MTKPVRKRSRGPSRVQLTPRLFHIGVSQSINHIEKKSAVTLAVTEPGDDCEDVTETMSFDVSKVEARKLGQFFFEIANSL